MSPGRRKVLLDGPAIIEVDDQRRDYGEQRIIAYGSVVGRVLVCVYTWRGITPDPSSRSDLNLAKIDRRRVDATTDEGTARQAAADPDTAPLFTTDEILAAGRGIVPDEMEDVWALRTRLGLSYEAFAARFGFSVDAIRQPESHRRVPTGPARTIAPGHRP